MVTTRTIVKNAIQHSHYNKTISIDVVWLIGSLFINCLQLQNNVGESESIIYINFIISWYIILLGVENFSQVIQKDNIWNKRLNGNKIWRTILVFFNVNYLFCFISEAVKVEFSRSNLYLAFICYLREQGACTLRKWL